MLRGVEQGRVRALHRARVASRRLREVLPVLQLDSRTADRLGRRLRRVTRRLGAVRELDVMLLLLDQLRKSARYDADAVARVTTFVSKQHREVRENLSSRLPPAALRRIGSKLEKIVGTLVEPPRPTARGWRWAIEARVGRRAAGLRSAVAAAGAVYLPDRVHAVRIAAKKLRYAIELQSEVSQDAVWREHLATLKRTQSLLGRLNDRQVLIDRVRQVQASLMPPTIEIWRGLDGLVTTLEKECRRLHARYLRDAASLTALCGRVIVSGAAAGHSPRARATTSPRRAG